jgi:hypothetical protein
VATRDVILNLKLKPPTAAALNDAFKGIGDAADKASAEGERKSKSGGSRLVEFFKEQAKERVRGGGGFLGKLFEAGKGDVAAGVGGEGAAAGAEGGSAGLAGAGVAAIGVAAGAMIAVKAFGMLKEKLNDLAQFTLQAVGKANPAAIERLNLAFDDLQAVAGHALTPVVEVATDAVRLLADVFQDIMPGTNEVRDALQPIKDFIQDLRPALAEITPIIRDFISLGVKGLGEALKWLQGIFHEFMSGLGLKGKLASSVGAAAKPLQFGTQEQFAKQAYAAAYLASQGTAGSVRKERSLVDIADDIYKDVEKLVVFGNNLLKEIGKVPTKVGDFVEETVGYVRKLK